MTQKKKPHLHVVCLDLLYQVLNDVEYGVYKIFPSWEFFEKRYSQERVEYMMVLSILSCRAFEDLTRFINNNLHQKSTEWIRLKSVVNCLKLDYRWEKYSILAKTEQRYTNSYKAYFLMLTGKEYKHQMVSCSIFTPEHARAIQIFGRRDKLVQQTFIFLREFFFPAVLKQMFRFFLFCFCFLNFIFIPFVFKSFFF